MTFEATLVRAHARHGRLVRPYARMKRNAYPLSVTYTNGPYDAQVCTNREHMSTEVYRGDRIIAHVAGRPNAETRSRTARLLGQYGIEVRSR